MTADSPVAAGVSPAFLAAGTAAFTTLRKIFSKKVKISENFAFQIS